MIVLFSETKVSEGQFLSDSDDAVDGNGQEDQIQVGELLQLVGDPVDEVHLQRFDAVLIIVVITQNLQIRITVSQCQSEGSAHQSQPDNSDFHKNLSLICHIFFNRKLFINFVSDK